MAEHEHGSMDTTTHEKTFENFMSLTAKVGVALLVLAVFLALVAT